MTTLSQFFLDTEESKRTLHDGIRDRRGGSDTEPEFEHPVKVSGALADLFDGLPLASFVAHAWASYRSVQNAIENTKGKPGTVELVQLARHTVDTNVPVIVESEAAGVTYRTFEFELGLSFIIEPCTLTIRNGEIEQEERTLDLKSVLKYKSAVLASKSKNLMKVTIPETHY